MFAHAIKLMEQQHFSSEKDYLLVPHYKKHNTARARNNTYYLFAKMPHQSLIATMRIASSQKTSSSSSSSSSSSLKTTGKISSLSSSSRRRRRRKTSALFTSASSNDKPAVVILPGLGNATEDYEEFQEELSSRGYVATSIAQVARPDWLRNAAGIVKPSYWLGTLEPRPTVDWYLERINNAIDEARNASENNGEVVLLAHSAGGWLSRVYLESKEDFANAKLVSKIISLGSPLNAVPLDVPGVVDQTRGILTYVEANCLSPKALGIEWICLAGTYKTGVKEFSRERFSDFIVGQGYKQVCGAADASGDGITPVESAQLQLEGVENIVLDGVFHTPVWSNNEERPWYGTKKILDLWVSKI